MILQLQLKTKGKSAERSSQKDWNGIEKRMAHRAPIVSTTLELWRLYGCGGTLRRTVPKGDQDRHNFLTIGCSSIMYAYIVCASKIHGCVEKFCVLKWKYMRCNIICCDTLLGNLARCLYKHQQAPIFDEL